jgi:hypothetical protein
MVINKTHVNVIVLNGNWKTFHVLDYCSGNSLSSDVQKLKVIVILLLADSRGQTGIIFISHTVCVAVRGISLRHQVQWLY